MMARDIIFLDELNRGRNRDKPLPVVLFADIDAECKSSALVKGLLGTGASSVVFGDSGSGKTFAALDLAFHVAADRDWFGHRTSRGGVLYVAGEGSLGVRNRLAAIKKHYQATDLPLGIVTTAVDLRSEQADTDRLIDAAAHLGDEFGLPVVLVVIDTLSRALAGGNESASEDMGALVMNIDRVRQSTGAHVLLIHHSGKDQAKGARGHSLLRAAVDTEIEVSRDDNKVSTLRVTKQRDMPADISPISFRLEPVELGTDADGDAVSSMVVIPSDAPATNKGKPPSPKARAFHRALLDALAVNGLRRAESAGLPSVTSDEWKRECSRLGLVDAAAPDNRQRALISKYRLELIGANWAACNGDLVWSTATVAQ